MSTRTISAERASVQQAHEASEALRLAPVPHQPVAPTVARTCAAS